MRNLAGDQSCDEAIERELVRCGITIVRDQPLVGEVPSSFRGKLGALTFRRAWYYWVVKGPVPLVVARELYADPVGREDVRINGHCGCPAPGEPGGNIVWRSRGHEPCDDPAATGDGFIESYHVDSEVGLRLLADTLKKHGLV